MRHQALTAALVLGLLTTAVSVAHAQGTAEDRAGQLAREALSLFEQGRWAESVAAFDQAGQLAKSPVFDLYSARALRNAGKLVEAQQRFQRAAQTELGADAPEAFQKARSDAKEELAQVTRRIPKLRLRPSRPLVGGVLVVDGREVDASAAIPVNPGRHTVIVSEHGAELLKRDVDAADGGGAVEIAFELPESNVDGKKPTSVATTGAGASSEGSLVPGIVVLSAGVASLVVGGVTGGLALSQKNDLETVCPGGACPESARDDLDSANRLATASTATFIIGGILAAGGVTLMILRPGGTSADPGVKASMQPLLGVDRAGLTFSGSF